MTEDFVAEMRRELYETDTQRLAAIFRRLHDRAMVEAETAFSELDRHRAIAAAAAYGTCANLAEAAEATRETA